MLDIISYQTTVLKKKYKTEEEQEKYTPKEKPDLCDSVVKKVSGYWRDLKKQIL